MAEATHPGCRGLTSRITSASHQPQGLGQIPPLSRVSFGGKTRRVEPEGSETLPRASVLGLCLERVVCARNALLSRYAHASLELAYCSKELM